MSADVPITVAGPMLVRMRPGNQLPDPPTSIVGEVMRLWCRADDSEIALDGDDLVTWPDKLSPYGSVDVGPHTILGEAFYCYPDVDLSDVRPVLEPLGLNGTFPAVRGEGSGSRLRWDFLGSPIPATYRPYVWVVAQATASPADDTWFLELYSAGLNQLVLKLGVQSGKFVSVAYPGGFAETIVGPSADTGRHLFEYGFLPTVGNRLVVDGVGYSGTGSGPLAWGLDGYHLFNLHAADKPMGARVAELIVADRVPCAARLLALRERYFARMLYGLVLRLDGVPASYGVDTLADKDLPCLDTVNDGDLACAQGLTYTPLRLQANQGYVTVIVDGVENQGLAGDKLHGCYFSGDGGTTARPLNAIVAGDKLYWNGSVMGWQLSSDQRVSFHYGV